MSDAHAALEHYLANALSTDERLAFEAHATSCASCTREIANWRSFGTVLKAQLAPVRRAPTRAEVAELISLADEPRTLWPRWLLPTLVAASAVVAVTVVSLALRSRSAPEEWSPGVVASSGLRSQAGALATDATGRALVKLGDDELGLGPQTTVRIARASSSGTTLVMKEGVIAAHVNPARGARSFDIETPLGRVHVVGTVFRARCTAEVLQVDVIRGVVEVSQGGSLTRVRAGQALVLKGGAGSLTGFDASEYTELMAEPPPAPVIAPPVPEVDAGVVLSAEGDAVKRSAPVAAWRTAAAHGECATVIQAAERFVQRDASDADAWLILGDCRRREKSFDKAVAAYVAASKTREASGKNGLLQAAELLQQELKQPQQAIALVDSYLRTRPERRLEAAALVRKALALKDLGRTGEARAVLSDTVKRLPDTASASEANRLLQGL